MSDRRLARPFAALLLAALAAAPAAQDSESDGRRGSTAVTKIWLERIDRAVYHLIDAHADEAPQDGYGLLVVLPGGNGGYDDHDAFLPFVQSGIHDVAAPDDFVTALGVATRWYDDQHITWPTAFNTVRNADWPTESYVRHVIADVARRRPIDPERVVLLGWSSSGPAVYATLLDENRPTDKGYIAMSVFIPQQRDERFADGLRLVLDQSPDDEITPLHYAITARANLTDHGAAVWLREYAGGHGWNDRPLQRIRSAVDWLLAGDPVPENGGPEDAGTGPDADGNLLRNGSFESGTAGWRVIDASGRFALDFDTERRAHGDKSLALTKQGGLPVDVVRQDFDLDGARRVRVAAWLAAADVGRAYLKFFAYDADGELLNDEVDVVAIDGDREGGVVTESYEFEEAADRGVVMLVMVTGGRLWVDDVRVAIGDG